MTAHATDRGTPGPIPPPSLDPGALLRTAVADTLTRTAGPCRQPIRLTNTRTRLHQATGLFLGQEHETITARCGTRRATQCPSCSTLYKYDTYHLITAGLRGGKSTPATVSTHPRLFVTLTAPSFGPVHLGPDKKGTPRACHPRRTGQGPSCRTWHRPADPRIGTPIDPDTYDYTGHTLFNATAGRLWSRFTTDLRRHLAEAAGIPRDRLREELTVSYAKVAEYQARGIIHYHAVIRLDGADGPTTTPPTWATTSTLENAIRAALDTATITTPTAPGLPRRTLRFGTQTDITPITTAQDSPLTERAVARYIAKYATKTTESTGTEIRPLTCRTCHATGTTTRQHPDGHTTSAFCPRCHGTGRHADWSALLGHDVTDHARRLITTCWTLGAHPELADLKLRQWAHMLGFKGHVSTRSRIYSTTLTALRTERATYQAALNTAAFGTLSDGQDDENVLVINHWRYAGRAPTPTAPPPPPPACDPGGAR
jgi:hypothetical protein